MKTGILVIGLTALVFLFACKPKKNKLTKQVYISIKQVYQLSEMYPLIVAIDKTIYSLHKSEITETEDTLPERGETLDSQIEYGRKKAEYEEKRRVKEHPLLNIFSLAVRTDFSKRQEVLDDGGVLGYCLTKDTATINQYILEAQARGDFPIDAKLKWISLPELLNGFGLIAVKGNDTGIELNNLHVEKIKVEKAGGLFSTIPGGELAMDIAGKTEFNIYVVLGVDGLTKVNKLNGDKVDYRVEVELNGKKYLILRNRDELTTGIRLEEQFNKSGVDSLKAAYGDMVELAD